MSKISKCIHENSFSLPQVHPGLQLFNEMGRGLEDVFISGISFGRETFYFWCGKYTFFLRTAPLPIHPDLITIWWDRSRHILSFSRWWEYLTWHRNIFIWYIISISYTYIILCISILEQGYGMIRVQNRLIMKKNMTKEKLIVSIPGICQFTTPHYRPAKKCLYLRQNSQKWPKRAKI